MEALCFIRSFDGRKKFIHSVEISKPFAESFNSYDTATNRFEESAKRLEWTSNRCERAINHSEETINRSEETIKYNLLHFNTLHVYLI